MSMLFPQIFYPVSLSPLMQIELLLVDLSNLLNVFLIVH